jgi:hypothetical protein
MQYYLREMIPEIADLSSEIGAVVKPLLKCPLSCREYSKRTVADSGGIVRRRIEHVVVQLAK